MTRLLRFIRAKLNSRSATPDSRLVSSIARVMLGDADDGYDEESFVKGYKDGFDTGWRAALERGIRIGKKLARLEAEAESKNGEGSEDSKSQRKFPISFAFASQSFAARPWGLFWPRFLIKCRGQCAF